MKNHSLYLFCSFLLFCGVELNAQDEHFTQYRLSPLTLNPGEVGQFEGDWRFSSLYRNQWRAIGDPFKTISASYDTKLYFLPPSWSFGMQVISDRTGSAGYQTDHVDMIVGHEFQAGITRISVGLKGGMHMKRYDLSDISFPEQYNYELGLYDPSFPLSESGLTDRLSYFDVASGVSLRHEKADFGYTAGFALHHINRPSDSFFGNDYRLSTRKSTYLKVYRQFDEVHGVAADLLSMYHNKASQWNFGLTYLRFIEENDAGIMQVSIGARGRSGFNRNGDALMVDFAVHSRHFDVGFAYDLNISGLSAATNNRGAFEIGVSYRSASSKIQQISIPCVRY